MLLGVTEQPWRPSALTLAGGGQREAGRRNFSKYITCFTLATRRTISTVEWKKMTMLWERMDPSRRARREVQMCPLPFKTFSRILLLKTAPFDSYWGSSGTFSKPFIHTQYSAVGLCAGTTKSIVATVLCVRCYGKYLHTHRCASCNLVRNISKTFYSWENLVSRRLNALSKITHTSWENQGSMKNYVSWITWVYFNFTF